MVLLTNLSAKQMREKVMEKDKNYKENLKDKANENEKHYHFNISLILQIILFIKAYLKSLVIQFLATFHHLYSTELCHLIGTQRSLIT